MKAFVLFGVFAPDLESAAKDLNSALDIQAEPHESISIGVYYAYRGKAGEKLKLISKILYDQEEEYEAEPTFPEWNVFLYVDHTNLGFPLISKVEENPQLFRKLRVNLL